MKANRSEFPLTRFIGMLLAYTDEQLRVASAAKASDSYGIPLATAAGYIRLYRQSRGIKP